MKILNLLAKIFSVIAGFSSYMTWLPPKYLPVSVIVFGIASTLKDALAHIEELFNPPSK